MNRAEPDTTPPTLTPLRLFWVMFWGTILVLALLYVYAQLKVARLSSDDRGGVLVSEELYLTLELVLPEVLSDMQREFDTAITEFERQIPPQIDAAFAPVYRRIPQFLEFHYSVIGEYTELAAASSGRMGADLERILFGESGFEQHLEQTIAAIGRRGDTILDSVLTQLNRRLQDRLVLDDSEMHVLSGVLTLTIEDAAERFGTSEMVLKSAGALAGASAAAAAMAKTLGTKAAAKLAAKMAGKSAVKAAGVGASGAAGAAAGLLCGPAAWICAPVAGTAAAITAWFATDKAVIEVDEYFNRESFADEIRSAIEAEKRGLAVRLTNVYRQRLQAILEDNKTKLKEMTTREVIERADP